MNLVVVVLAGGEGVRMGGRKPLQPWGETTLLGQALDRARRYAAAPAVAVRRPDQLEGATDAPLLVDDPAIPGPMAGLASALRYSRDRGAAAVLTLPCDMPLAPDDLADRLAEALGEGVNVALPQSGGRWHPACALWRAHQEDQLRAYAAEGRSSLRGFAQAVGCAVVDWGEADPDPFANANTPEELAALRARAGP